MSLFGTSVVDEVIISSLQVRKQRHREVKRLPQGPTARRVSRADLETDSLASKFVLSASIMCCKIGLLQSARAGWRPLFWWHTEPRLSSVSSPGVSAGPALLNSAYPQGPWIPACVSALGYETAPAPRFSHCCTGNLTRYLGTNRRPPVWGDHLFPSIPTPSPSTCHKMPDKPFSSNAVFTVPLIPSLPGALTASI